jgi:transcriptional repressor NrdR
MRCPFCGGLEDKVVDSRLADGGKAIRRRRECEACGSRFTTFERSEEVELMIEKRDGTREPFIREKLVGGLEKAFKNRPVIEGALERLADDVVEAARTEGGNVVRSADIGREVLERLRSMDEVAYLRFASVYKDFKELNDFERELGQLQKKVPPKERTVPRG